MKHLIAMFLVAFLLTSAVVLSWSEYFLLWTTRGHDGNFIYFNSLMLNLSPKSGGIPLPLVTEL